MAKIEIERVAERGAGLSGGREIAKNKKTSGGASRGANPKMRGAMAPLGPPRSYAPGYVIVSAYNWSWFQFQFSLIKRT